MRKVAWIFLLLTAGCHDKQSLSIEPNQLIGTWNAPSSSGKPYSRWTFEKDYLYKVEDNLKVCQQAQSQPYQYRIEEDVLVIRYVGFTNGLIPIQDERFPVVSISQTNFTLVFPDSQRREFEKCP